MSLVSITARNVRGIDPLQGQRVSVDLDMTDAQIFEAIDELLDARTPTQRLAWIEQINERQAERSS